MKKPPKTVVLACIAQKIDLAALFCYEVTETEIVLHLNSGQVVRVAREELTGLGPAPIDARSQPAPGKVQAGPCGDPPSPPEGGARGG